MDLLDRVLKHIISKNQTLRQGVQDAKILETWPSAVGPQLAKHAQAFQVKNKTLLIAVDHPVWKQELHANKLLALKRLNEKLSESFGTQPKTWIEDLFLISTNQTKAKPRTE